jgi:hypothetical protein
MTHYGQAQEDRGLSPMVVTVEAADGRQIEARTFIARQIIEGSPLWEAQVRQTHKSTANCGY